MADKAYVLVNLHVTDFDRYFAEYIPPTMGTVVKHGGKVLVATNAPETVEGNTTGNWHVVIEFPSMEAAKAWYADLDYAGPRSLRMTDLTTGGDLSFAPAFVPPG